MGCINSNENFSHWFGNIHLSGPCNAKCYFCIGQHMMELDALNTLDVWPLPGFGEFIAKAHKRGVHNVYLTGTNTDPWLFKHHTKLVTQLHGEGFIVGLRTNGIGWLTQPTVLELYDKVAISIPTMDPLLYREIMGVRMTVPVHVFPELHSNVKANVVLCEETRGDVLRTIRLLGELGYRRINLREPYGQPHMGDPCKRELVPMTPLLGMPRYHGFDRFEGGSPEVLYWDVHHVEVESVNLYANGRVSETYPITEGHSDKGFVNPQWMFPGGRLTEQWKGRKNPQVGLRQETPEDL